MGKREFVLLLGSGIFNEGPGFWSEAMTSFRELGHDVYPLKNAFRMARFFQEPSRELSELDLLGDVDRMRQQVEVARDVFGPGKKYIFVGHSKAGLIGQVLVQERLFDGLVALNPSMPKGFSAVSVSSLWYMKSVLLQVLLKLRAKVCVKRSFGDTIGGVLHPDLSEEKKIDFYQSLSWESGKVIWDLAFIKPQVFPSLINIPIFLIAGRKDMLVKANAVQALANWYKEYGKKVELEIFDDLAHYPTEEQIKILVHFVDNWIKKVA